MQNCLIHCAQLVIFPEYYSRRYCFDCRMVMVSSTSPSFFWDKVSKKQLMRLNSSLEGLIY